MDNLAQYGIAIFAIGGVFALINASIGVVKQYVDKKSVPTLKCGADQLSTVIANNTKAIEELQVIFRVALAEQGVKMDEVLSRIKEQKS